MIGNWTSDGDPLLSTTLSNQSGQCYHLTAERLAPNSWEWLAWSVADEPGKEIRRGVTSSPGTAMVAAENAVVEMESVAAALHIPRAALVHIPRAALVAVPNCPPELDKNCRRLEPK
jgi:hypothetical protein